MSYNDLKALYEMDKNSNYIPVEFVLGVVAVVLVIAAIGAVYDWYKSRNAKVYTEVWVVRMYNMISKTYGDTWVQYNDDNEFHAFLDRWYEAHGIDKGCPEFCMIMLGIDVRPVGGRIGCWVPVKHTKRAWLTKSLVTAVLVMVMMYSGVAQADEWKTSNTALELTYQALAVVDYSQTRYIVSHNRREGNPILGERPSKGEVTAYFIATGVVHAAISYGLSQLDTPDWMPCTWSQAWQSVTIGVEGGVVVHNFSAGVKMDF